MLAAMWHVFEGLYDLDLHTYKPYAALAAGDPVKLDDLEYEIALRSDAKFSDGSDVTTFDVVNAFERNMADPTYGALLSFIAGVSAKDDATISLRLNYPFESLIKSRLSIVKIFPARLSDDDLGTKPIGSGPWLYDAIDGSDGGAITFKPNPHYNGSVPATAETMHWDIMLDGADRAAAMVDGSVSVIENAPDSSIDQLKNAGAAIEYIQGFGQAFLMFNCQKPPFNDHRVRQAFFYAIDAEKLVSDVLNGHGELVTGFLPKTFLNYHRASTVYTHDVDKAKALLEEAGIEKLTFTMTTNNNWVKDLAAHIQNDLAEVGITMKNEEERIDWATLAPSDSNDVLPFDVILTPGNPSCFGNDPDLLMSWWYGDNVWTRGRSCWAKAGDGAFEELQRLMQEARVSMGDDQQALWNRCFDVIAEHVPLYALFHREIACAYKDSDVEGFEPIATTGLDFLGVSPR